MDIGRVCVRNARSWRRASGGLHAPTPTECGGRQDAGGSAIRPCEKQIYMMDGEIQAKGQMWGVRLTLLSRDTNARYMR